MITITARPLLVFVVACPRLTELTIFPYPYDFRITEREILHDPAGKALPAISELVFACESLPDFDTIQILCFPTLEPYKILSCERGKCSCSVLCKGKAGRQEREGRRRTTVRVIRFSSVASFTCPPSNYPADSVEVEVYEV